MPTHMPTHIPTYMPTHMPTHIPTHRYDQPQFRIVDVQTLQVLKASDNGTVLLSKDIDSPSSIWSYIYNNVIVCVQYPGKVLSVEGFTS